RWKRLAASASAPSAETCTTRATPAAAHAEKSASGPVVCSASNEAPGPASRKMPAALTTTCASRSASASAAAAGGRARSRGRQGRGRRWAGINAISHWLFGSRAYGLDEASRWHGIAGLVIHQLSSLFWGVLYDALLGNVRRDLRVAGDGPARRGATVADAV